MLINAAIQRRQLLFSLLSIISNNTLCLSLKRERKDYFGYCLRLRRSDDEEKDFGFHVLTNQIDSQGIDAWLNSDTAFNI
jgi:hypothetical protein